VAKQIGVRTERYKLIFFYENNEWELYDLEKDKHEMNNVYDQPAYKKVQEMMMKKLKEKKEQYKDPVTLNDPSKKV
jgi:arylsulfatase A-like enzyme